MLDVLSLVVGLEKNNNEFIFFVGGIQLMKIFKR
jgi:hypothetical protein